MDLQRDVRQNQKGHCSRICYCAVIIPLNIDMSYVPCYIIHIVRREYSGPCIYKDILNNGPASYAVNITVNKSFIIIFYLLLNSIPRSLLIPKYYQEKIFKRLYSTRLSTKVLHKTPSKSRHL